MIFEEAHEEWNITPNRDAIMEMDIPITDEVIDNAKVVELESNGFENIKETKNHTYWVYCVKVKNNNMRNDIVMQIALQQPKLFIPSQQELMQKQ